MTRASQVSATLHTDAVPALPGAEEVLAGGIASSLAPSNAAAALAAVRDATAAVQHARWPLLLDPQTGGGLLAGVPDRAEACLKELQSLGYHSAAIIGEVTEGDAIIDIF
jgi:selenide,water dikinase